LACGLKSCGQFDGPHSLRRDRTTRQRDARGVFRFFRSDGAVAQPCANSWRATPPSPASISRLTFSAARPNQRRSAEHFTNAAELIGDFERIRSSYNMIKHVLGCYGLAVSAGFETQLRVAQTAQLKDSVFEPQKHLAASGF
jgi:hypothetical protein